MFQSTLYRFSSVLVALFVATMAFPAYASMSDIKFGQYQLADSQWNVSACLNTTTCQIYSKNPGTAYKIPWWSGQVQWAAGDYVKLESSGDPNYPYVARQYSSTGVLKETLGTGKIVNMGPDYFFFVGNDDNTGQLFSGSSGMSDTSGVTWTGTLNPTTAEADAYATQTYSTTPLAPGETASSPPPPTYGVNFTRIISYEWKNYTAGSQPISAENADEAFDNNDSKWFGYRSQGAWVVVQLVDNSTQYSATRAVQKIQFRTANDAEGRDPTGYRVWGSADGVNWVLIKEEAIALPSGRNTDSQVYELNNVTAYSYYKIEFTGVKDGGDAFQINEIRLLYDVDDPQGELAGGGVYVQPTPVYSSSITQAQASRRTINLAQTIGHNANVAITGSDNIVDIAQIGGQHYSSVVIVGDFNEVDIVQTAAFQSRHYLETAITGNSNILVLNQSDADKNLFVNINGLDNNLSVDQSGTGNHYLDITLVGNDHVADITQLGSGNHNATIELVNAGGAWNFQLTQNGAVSQTYSLPHDMSDGSTVNGICATMSGCNLTVTQQ
jgi:hypothetical protein